jgi:RNA polymerase sigma-70 factor (ECF subfamily)
MQMRAFQDNTHPTIEPSIAIESDSSLVLLAKQDIGSFAMLYERYRDDVLRYCVHCLGNWDDAGDATQQTFTNALVGLPKFQDTNDSFRSWLFRIAHNEVINRHRQRARRLEHSLNDASWIADPERTPEELAILSDEHTQVYMLLLSLTPEQRRCCELRFAGLSYCETAAILGKSEVAARASFCRGLAALRDLLEDMGSSR